MNKIITDILDTLASKKNIFKIIELSKKYDEINIEDYYQYLPESIIIDVNTDMGFYELSLHNLMSFKLKNDNKKYTLLKDFLYNIDFIQELYFKEYKVCVTDGNFYTEKFNSDYYMYNFTLHSLNGLAIKYYNKKYSKHNKYCIYGKIVSEKKFKYILKKNKLNRIMNKNNK